MWVYLNQSEVKLVFPVNNQTMRDQSDEYPSLSATSPPFPALTDVSKCFQTRFLCFLQESGRRGSSGWETVAGLHEC